MNRVSKASGQPTGLDERATEDGGLAETENELQVEPLESDSKAPTIGPDAVVEFESSGQRFALALSALREIAATGVISRIPGAPPSVLGLMNKGGRAYTIIDLCALLAEAEDDSRCVNRRAAENGEGKKIEVEARLRSWVMCLDVPGTCLGLCVDRLGGIGPLTSEKDHESLGGGRVKVLSLDALLNKVDSTFR